MSNHSGSTPLRAAALLLLLLFSAGQAAAMAAAAQGEAKHASAWVRAAGARALSSRDFTAPDCNLAALPVLPVELTPAGPVVSVRADAPARALAPRSMRPRAALPRGPPVPA